MLFPYNYCTHSMEKMQEFIDYIFFQVWCKALEIGYSFELYNGKPELKEIFISFHYDSLKYGDFFNARVEEIFGIFKTLSSEEIDQLKNWYKANNNIEKLCENDQEVKPVSYVDIEGLNKDLAFKLKDFFVTLYSQNLLSLKAISDKIGYISDHYNEFIKINSNGRCPFCGLYPIDNEYVKTREAYDHYLPKSKYPFSSINFKNLAPICHKCNSGNKSTKDPLYRNDGTRRKSFFPYSETPFNISLKINLNTKDIEKLKPENIEITFGPDNLSEEIETWNDVFSIEERYKAMCCSADAKYWIIQVIEECGSMSSIEFLSSRLNCAEKYPFVDNNFLRAPFIRACKEKDII